jgi:protein gp37
LFGQRRQGCSSRHSIVVRLWNIGTITEVLFFTEIHFNFKNRGRRKRTAAADGRKLKARVGNVMPIALVSL